MVRRLQSNSTNSTNGTTAQGVSILTSIDLKKFAELTGGTITPDAMLALASSVVTNLQSSAFISAIVSAIETASGLPPGSLAALVPPSSITQAVSTQTVSTGGSQTTAGGDPFYIGGIMSIATVDTSLIRIIIGGKINIT